MYNIKYCNKCNIEKSLDKFSKDKYGENGFHSICKECIKLYRFKNKEKIKNYNKEYELKRAEKRKKYDREYAKKNIKKRNIQKKNWKKTEKGKIAVINLHHKRRTKYKETDITSEWLLSFKKEAIHCSLCSCKLEEIKTSHPRKKHLDHVVPLNVGGTHTMDNVRYLCQTCNLQRPKDGRDLLIIKNNR